MKTTIITSLFALSTLLASCHLLVSIDDNTPTPGICGDDNASGAETCDGSDFRGETCLTQGFSSGQLICASTCDALITDGCSHSSCGNGVLDEGETCDDGFADACGTCNEDCSGPGSGSICGDGEVCPETEACDDGFTDACGSCNEDCSGPGAGSVCGDSEVCPETEACDDGFTDACGTCNGDCSGSGSGSI
ncbi:hypothetical protein KJ865_02940, partial [Myxococcota bacterium]|nr:hypothetical protein [Myxococcota bacterium]